MTRILVLAVILAAPAVSAKDDALQTLYRQAERSASAGTPQGKEAARARYGRYAPVNAASAPSPAHSELHVHRLPDGRAVLQCRSVHHPVPADLNGGNRDGREQR